MTSFDYTRYETEIDLVKYAALFGYEIDKRKDCAAWRTMQSNGDKIIIFKKGGKWKYFNRHDESDYGNITNFIKNRTHKSNIEVGLELNSWLGNTERLPIPADYNGGVKQAVYNPKRIQKLFSYCKSVHSHPYLEYRGLAPNITGAARFSGRIYEDSYGNVIFPHFKKGRVSALQRKNHSLDVFSKGSEKTFWRSNLYSSDHTIVISEAVIDCLSYGTLFSADRIGFLATCGETKKQLQSDLVRLIQAMPRVQRIIGAFDNDQAGDKLYQGLSAYLKVHLTTIEIIRHSPEKRGDDWNDVLTNQQKEKRS